MNLLKIAICIPTFNRGKMIASAIDSLLLQRTVNFDVHVFDNASTDGTEDFILTRYAGALFYHRHTGNLGYVGNINACLSLYEKYDWIGILHSDDRHEGESVANARGLIAKHSNAGLIFSAINTMDASGEIYERANGQYRIFNKGVEAVERCRGRIPCSTVFFNCSSLRECGLYDPAFPYSADEEHNARIASRYDIVESGQVLASYRRHAGHMMTKTWLQPDFISNFESMRLKMASYAGKDSPAAVRAVKRELGQIFLSCAMDLVISGHQKAARPYYRYAWEYNPFQFLRPMELTRAVLGLAPVLGPFSLRIVHGIWRTLAQYSR
jgi:glycosyltransferase involved in cell wall biosynthesis